MTQGAQPERRWVARCGSHQGGIQPTRTESEQPRGVGVAEYLGPEQASKALRRAGHFVLHGRQRVRPSSRLARQRSWDGASPKVLHCAYAYGAHGRRCRAKASHL